MEIQILYCWKKFISGQDDGILTSFYFYPIFLLNFILLSKYWNKNPKHCNFLRLSRSRWIYFEFWDQEIGIWIGLCTYFKWEAWKIFWVNFHQIFPDISKISTLKFERFLNIARNFCFSTLTKSITTFQTKCWYPSNCYRQNW